MRRSGTTILYDALRADPELRCFYEPLREEDGHRRRRQRRAPGRRLRRDPRAAAAVSRPRYPELELAEFNWGGPRAPELELEPELPEHCRELLRHLIAQAPHGGDQGDPAAPQGRRAGRARPRRWCSSTWCAIRAPSPRRPCSAAAAASTSIPTPTPSSARRTDRKLWSSRAISERLARTGAAPGLGRRRAGRAAPARGLGGRVRGRPTATGVGCSAIATCCCASRTCGAEPASALERDLSPARPKPLPPRWSPGRAQNVRGTTRRSTSPTTPAGRRRSRRAGARRALGAAGYADLVGR